MPKEKEITGLYNSPEPSLNRMKRWWACQRVAKALFDSTTSDVEVLLLLQQAETGMFESKDKKI